MNNKINIAEQYREFTDKYFIRTRQILEAEGINPLARYQCFARKGDTARGVDEAVDFIRNAAGDKARIYALKDGELYEPCEPLMKIEGRVQDLVELETGYLGMISGRLTGKIDLNEVREKARAIVKAAQGKDVLYFGARHFHWTLDEKIAGICNEEGFVGASTDAGAGAWGAEGMGTIPHALIVSYAAYMHENNIDGNATVEAAKGFDKHIDKNVPRIVLIDTFNREIDDTIAAKALGKNLHGVRIDTCGENYAQGVREIEAELPELDVSEKYLKGKGVSIAAVWALRKAMVNERIENLELVVSSGFNAEKTAAFVKADRIFQNKYGLPLFTAIGTGSIANPIMATADIVAYFNEKQNKWIEMHKVGRPEIETGRLKEAR